MPRGGNDIEDLEDLLLEDVAYNESLDLEIDPVTGIRAWRRSSDGALHHPTEPALVFPDGTREWYQENRRQSLDGEPSRILPDGTREWHAAGELESIDGAPSRILPDGTREWHRAGFLEGLPGSPSRILPDGTREWHRCGLLESLDGAPSRILPDGTREWHRCGLLESLDGAPSRILPDGTRQWHRAGELAVINNRPSIVFPDETCYWSNKGLPDRADGPAVICPTKEAQENNDGLLWAYYYRGRLMRISPSKDESSHNQDLHREPCQAWAGDDPRLVFWAGYQQSNSYYYYYVIHADGRESLINAQGFVLQATSADGEILKLDWHREEQEVGSVAETLEWFLQARTKEHNISELQNPSTPPLPDDLLP